MSKTFIFIAIAALVVYAGSNYYLYRRSWQAFPPNPTWHLIYAILFAIVALSFFIAMGLGNKLPLGVATVLENIGAYWIIAFVFFLLVVDALDLVRLANQHWKFYPPWVINHYQQIKLITFFGTIGLFAIVCLLGHQRVRNPEIKQLDIEVAKNDNQGGELRIVMVSDVHLGNTIRKNLLKKFVRLLNEQQADIILFAGDLIDHSMRPVEAHHLDEELRQLKAKYGVFGIPGNHEYYANMAKASDFYARSGITLLRDTALTIDNRFVLIGRNDVTQHRRKPLDEILRGVDTHRPTILLDHNPSKIRDAVNQQIDLQLSGHTHDGQLFPINLIVRGMYELSYGYRQIGNTHIYVSSGLGLWAAPIRIGTRSEIVRINMHFPLSLNKFTSDTNIP